MTRSLLVAIMRNEAPYILEWVANHRALGFTDLLVFTNDCTDGTDAMLDRLDDLHLVRHCPNPKSMFPALGVWQVAALRYASAFGVFRRADWVATVDADEFIEIRAGAGRLDDLFDAAGPFDVMSLPVVGYCSDADPLVGAGAVQSRFRRARTDISPGAAGKAGPMAIKSIQRPGIPKAHFRNHRPKIDGFSSTGMIWCDGSGCPMPPDFTDRKVNSHVFDTAPALAHVNHHSLRSRNAFIVKALRGDAVTASRLGVETREQIENAARYWTARNRSDLPERQATRPPMAQALQDDLMADPILGPLHAQACAIHDAAAEALLKTPAGAALAASLTMTAP